MDVPIINETCFSAANPSSYSLAEIWSSIPNPKGNGGVSGLRLSAETTTICDDDESSLTEHTRSRKNRRPDANSEIQSSSAANRNAKDLKDSSHKRSKVLGSKVLGSNHENCGSKAEVEASSGSGEKPTEPVKDYIHVRARRGQATDSHSLAERARREKISERMKILQNLVPGCNKVIGKALVLDEIINYIQSLQNQVEFLSMKLEAVNSRMEPTIEGFPLKNLGPPTLDATGLVFGSQTPREYVQGLQRDWLHIQVGSSIEKQHDS